ncbi:hypothetical protein BCV71DRAFT_176551, partial [Rhizopus microsporus]
ICIPTATAKVIDILFLIYCIAIIVVNRHVTEHRTIVCFDLHFVSSFFLSFCIFLFSSSKYFL